MRRLPHVADTDKTYPDFLFPVHNFRLVGCRKLYHKIMAAAKQQRATTGAPPQKTNFAGKTDFSLKADYNLKRTQKFLKGAQKSLILLCVLWAIYAFF